MQWHAPENIRKRGQEFLVFFFRSVTDTGKYTVLAFIHAAGLIADDRMSLSSSLVSGAHVSVVRLPPSVHGEGDHGFVPALVGIAREKGVSAYIGDGLNRWPAVHRSDAARLFRLALEKGTAGARYHGIAEEGIPVRDIAGVIGRHLNLPVAAKSPEETAGHFGWMAHFVALDNPGSSTQTQERLEWRPGGTSLIADLELGHYFQS